MTLIGSNVAANSASRGYVLESGQVVLEDSAGSLLNSVLVSKAHIGR